MDVPGSGRTGCEFDQADKRLLHYLPLVFQIPAQDLRQLRAGLCVRRRNGRKRKPATVAPESRMKSRRMIMAIPSRVEG
jgi:hypothetical protein